MINCISYGHKVNLRHVACDAILIKDNKILLAKRSLLVKGNKIPEGEKWCLPGGRLDQNETTTQGVMREVKEETGYDVENIKIFCINTNPARKNDKDQNVAFVFTADVLKQTSEPDAESSEIKWFDLNNLPDEEKMAFDHYDFIQLYLKNRDKKDGWPLLNV